MEEIRPGRYRHFKGGEYQVYFTARHSETEELMVVYKPLYGEGGMWVRPADMWSGTGTPAPDLCILEGNGSEHSDFRQVQVL